MAENRFDIVPVMKPSLGSYDGVAVWYIFFDLTGNVGFGSMRILLIGISIFTLIIWLQRLHCGSGVRKSLSRQIVDHGDGVVDLRAVAGTVQSFGKGDDGGEIVAYAVMEFRCDP